MSQRTFLELTHNPFAPPREGFFGGGDRSTHLEHLRHLSQWSRRILLVTGSFGIGKSTLFKELSGSLPGNAKAARISGSVVTAEREVLLAVAQGFGIACDQEGHIEDIVALVKRSVDEENEKDRQCVVMFDDAHLLAHTAVTLLVRLVAESSLRIVMFAEPALVNNLTSPAKKHEVEWFEIRLNGFAEQDVRDYLEWRFAQAQYRGRLPFTDAQVEKIAERSSGNPNVIDFMANELLADLETGKVRDIGGGFPRKHALLVVILGVLIFLVYQLYLQPPRNEPTLADASEAIEEPDLSTPSSLEEPIPDEPNPAELDESTQVVAEPVADIETIATTETEDVSTQVEPTALPSESSEPEPEPELAVVVAEEPEERAETEETEEPERSVEVPTPERVIPVEEASSPAIEKSEIPNDINGPNWLRAQNPNHYTLQLMTLSRTQGGAALIRRQKEPGEFAMYPLSRGDKRLYVVTYGVFSSQAAAERAGASLQGELSSVKPWIRPFANVQDAIAD